ncbi:hypothetical protein KEM55_002938, partial [Ascosphaera atra]
PPTSTTRTWLMLLSPAAGKGIHPLQPRTLHLLEAEVAGGHVLPEPPEPDSRTVRKTTPQRPNLKSRPKQPHRLNTKPLLRILPQPLHLKNTQATRPLPRSQTLRFKTPKSLVFRKSSLYSESKNSATL